MKKNKRILIESIVKTLMGENAYNLDENTSCANPVVQNTQGMKPCDFVQFYEKPGIIVAVLRGENDNGIQQLPIGAVDNFRFMKITDENAIQQFKDITNETENVKSYDQILKEYEQSKTKIIDSWKQGNGMAFEALQKKYGDKLLGVDIVQNDKKIQHKEEKDDEEENKVSDNGELKRIEEDDVNEGLKGKGKDDYGNKVDQKGKSEGFLGLKNSYSESLKKGKNAFSDAFKWCSQNDKDIDSVGIVIIIGGKKYQVKDFDILNLTDHEKGSEDSVKFDVFPEPTIVLEYTEKELGDSEKLTMGQMREGILKGGLKNWKSVGSVIPLTTEEEANKIFKIGNSEKNHDKYVTNSKDETIMLHVKNGDEIFPWVKLVFIGGSFDKESNNVTLTYSGTEQQQNAKKEKDDFWS